MKKIKNLLLLLLVFISTVAMSQPNLTFRFANAELVNMDTQLQFDVEVQADEADWWIYIAQLNFTYNTAAFGENIAANGATVEKGDMIDAEFLNPPFPPQYAYDVYPPGDPLTNMLGATAETNWDGTDPYDYYGVHAEWPYEGTEGDVWGHLFTVTIDIVDPSELAGIEFSIIMDGQESCQVGPDPLADPPEPLEVIVCGPNSYENDLLTFPLGDTEPLLFTWNSDGDGYDWDDGDNWDLDAVPTMADNVLIPDLPTKGMPNITGAAAALDVTIASFASLTIGDMGSLDTYGDFDVEMSGEFYIASGFSGSAGSYRDMAGTLTGSGMFHFGRDVIGGGANGADEGWHYISSPTAGFSTDDIPDYFLNLWTEADMEWTPQVGGDDCTPLPTISPMPYEGWSVKEDWEYDCPTPPMGPVIDFAGMMSETHTGPYPFDVTGSSVDVDPLGYENWNLLGNPYPSPVDNALFVAGFPAGVDGSIYFYDNAILDYAVWAAGLGVPQIPSTQGFFVHTNADGVFPISFDNTMRTHTGAGAFYKSTIEDYVELTVSGNELSNNLYVRFHEDATNGFDSKWDAAKISSNAGTPPKIFTTSGNLKFAIDTRPETTSVPVSFVCEKSGIFTIEAVETSQFPNVILEDKLTGDFTDLLSTSYDFTHSTGNDDNRFTLHFTPLGTLELEASSIDIWSYDRKINVYTPKFSTGNIFVYNMMGQEVLHTDIEPGKNVIPMTEVNTYYLVKVVTKDNIVTGKVYIK